MDAVEPDILYPPGRNVAVLKTGEELPVGPRSLTPSEVVAQIKTVVSRRYRGEDESKWGMSLLEAALLTAAEKAADGDLDALNKILDRIMGKPVQQTIQATGTLREFLDQLDFDPGAASQINPFDD